MSKILFVSDIDNTLIHSFKHKRDGDVCIEWKGDFEQAFMSEKAFIMLRDLKVDVLLVSSRSTELYRRLKLPCNAKYALVSNGSLLIENDVINDCWKAESEKIVPGYKSVLIKLLNEFADNEHIKSARLVDDMYLFLHCREKDDVQFIFEAVKRKTKLPVMTSGRKIYVVPEEFSKGRSVLRVLDFCNTKYDKVICAGDSKVDASMLSVCDVALVPDENLANMVKNKNILVCNKADFSEFVLEVVSEYVNGERP